MKYKNKFYHIQSKEYVLQVNIKRKLRLKYPTIRNAPKKGKLWKLYSDITLPLLYGS